MIYRLWCAYWLITIIMLFLLSGCTTPASIFVMQNPATQQVVVCQSPTYNYHHAALACRDKLLEAGWTKIK